MPKAPVKQAPPAKTTIDDTGADPLASFFTDRSGWARDDAGHWHYAPRDIRVVTLGPGNTHRFHCSIKGSKPVTFATRTGVEVWVVRAEGV